MICESFFKFFQLATLTLTHITHIILGLNSSEIVKCSENVQHFLSQYESPKQDPLKKSTEVMYNMDICNISATVSSSSINFLTFFWHTSFMLLVVRVMVFYFNTIPLIFNVREKYLKVLVIEKAYVYCVL